MRRFSLLALCPVRQVEEELEECAGAEVRGVHRCGNGSTALCVEVSSELQDEFNHLRNMDVPRGTVAVLPLGVEDELSVRCARCPTRAALLGA